MRLRRLVSEKVAESGLRIAAAGTHPFSSWMKQEITPLERYAGIIELDLSRVTPHVSGPDSVQVMRSVADIEATERWYRDVLGLDN